MANPTIGELIRRWRDERGLTQEALVLAIRHAGGAVSASTITHVETGRRNLSYETAEMVAAALDLTQAERAALHDARERRRLQGEDAGFVQGLRVAGAHREADADVAAQRLADLEVLLATGARPDLAELAAHLEAGIASAREALAEINQRIAEEEAAPQLATMPEEWGLLTEEQREDVVRQMRKMVGRE